MWDMKLVGTRAGALIVQELVTILALGTLFFLPGVVRIATAAPTDVTLNTFIVPDPCDVTLGGGDMTAGAIDFGDIDSSTLSAKEQYTPSKTFNVQLSNCGADLPNGSSIKPKITVTGTVIGTGTDLFLFRDTDSTANNLGFIFRFNDTTVTWGGPKGGNVQNGSVFDLSGITNWKNGNIPVAVAVSSGSSATVNGKGAAGLLKASVKFTFDYK
jgi:type 1 fimbria pilin